MALGRYLLVGYFGPWGISVTSAAPGDCKSLTSQSRTSTGGGILNQEALQKPCIPGLEPKATPFWALHRPSIDSALLNSPPEAALSISGL